jgi:tRNA-2-methylthio-N6-dimethylallyladenosine synthase
MQKRKLVHIATWGCQMNVYDSIKMGDLLKPHGFEITESFENADVAILNTCHIREKASEKIYSELGKVRLAKENKAKQGEHMVIAVAGCVAQAEGEEIFARAPFVDIVVGSQAYHQLPSLIEKVKREKGWAIDIDFPEESKFDKLPEDSGSQGISAFLSVQEGCDKFCHFCVVPYTRGAEYSRTVPEVYREALRLVSLGAKEIHLLGQNVSAYHGHDENGQPWGLGKLVKHLANIPKLERIRYITSHPRDMVEDELFEAHAQEKKLMPFLHLPVQSGSSKILAAMNRKHDRDFYFQIIDKFRSYRPDMAFSSDFIVGFPGETDQDFEDTMDLVRKVKFSQCYSFKYSPRPGTPASMLSNQVAEKVKTERLAQLQDLIFKLQTEFNQQYLGKTLFVLFDKPGRYPGQIQGKSEYMQAVVVTASSDKIGQVLPVKITSVESNSLIGELI